jgi:ABC-type antimicrobial peptide transport system permease subunit
VPGVTDIAATFDQSPVKRTVTYDNRFGDMKEEPVPLWQYHVVSAGYRNVFRRPLAAGRDFIDGDLDDNVVLVDLPTANYLWPYQTAVGRSLKFGNKDANLPWFRVIGVVGDIRDTATVRRYNPGMGFRIYGIYRLLKSTDSIVINKWGMGTLEVIARVDGNSELAAVRMQRQFRGFRTNQPPAVTPLVDQLGVGRDQAKGDFVSSLFSVFAGIGLALVAIGVFGIVAHSVEERRREIAVRISFGATARDILYAVLREGNALILVGIAIGLLATKYTIWWLQGFIIDNDGYNAPLMALIAAGLFAVAAFAAYIPALRATRIDPVDALRHE